MEDQRSMALHLCLDESALTHTAEKYGPRLRGLANSSLVHLRVFEGGYVRFAGIRDVCVQLEKEHFDAFMDLLDAGAGAPD